MKTARWLALVKMMRTTSGGNFLYVALLTIWGNRCVAHLCVQEVNQHRKAFKLPVILFAALYTAVQVCDATRLP